MLPMYPQSIMKTFFDSIKATKKVFISMLPLTIILIIIETGVNFRMHYYQSTLWSLCFLAIFSILSFFCSCWAICFVYEILAEHGASLKKSFITVLRRCWRTLFVLVPLIGLTVLLALVLWQLNNYLPVHKTSKLVLSIVLLFAAVLSVVIVSGFSIIYIVEVLIKPTRCLEAASQAFKVFFQPSNVVRFFGFMILFVLFFVILGLVLGVLLSLLMLLKLKLAISVAMIGIMAIPFLLFVVALRTVAVIYIYHNLTLRWQVR